MTTRTDRTTRRAAMTTGVNTVGEKAGSHSGCQEPLTEKCQKMFRRSICVQHIQHIDGFRGSLVVSSLLAYIGVERYCNFSLILLKLHGFMLDLYHSHKHHDVIFIIN